MAQTEEQKRELLELKQERVRILEQKAQLLEGQPEEGLDLQRGLGFLNRGIAQVFGAPVDLLNTINEAVGLRELPIPAGSEDIGAGLRRVGIAAAEEEPRTPTEVAFNEIGLGVASLVPFAGITRRAVAARQAPQALARRSQQQEGRVRGALSQTAEDIASTTARRPVTTTGFEAASIAGAGAGAGIGSESESQAVQTLTTIMGGLTPAALTQFPSLAKLGLRAGRAAIDPFTEQGSTFRAARRVQELAADPQAAARSIQETQGSAVPPAQRTGEQRLVGLQRALTDEDPNLERALQGRAQRAEEEALGSAREIGGAPPGAARDALGQRRAEGIERLQRSAADAVERVQRRVAELPESNPAQESRIVREELDRAHNAVRAEESRFWERVPEKARVAPSETKRTFSEIVESQGKLSDPEDLPSVVRSNVRRIGDQETVRELQIFRSRLLDEVRAERAKDAPNRRKIANLTKMQQALLADMERAPGGQALQDAIDFSRGMNEVFTQGPVGRVLGFERRGGPSVRGSEVLGRTLGRGGVAAAEDLRALRLATGDEKAGNQALTAAIRAARESPESHQAMSRFMQGLFRLQAVNPDGSISPSRAQTFLRRHREVLNEMPEVRRALDDAVKDQGRAERFVKRSDRMTRELSNRSRSALALFLDTPPDRAMARVLQSNNPSKAARSLLNTARKDKSGMAERGLKDEFVQHLFREAETGSVGDAGQRLVSGRRLQRLMDNSQVKTAMNRFLTMAERRRLRKIANELKTVEAGRDRAPSVGNPMDDLASSVLEIPARVLGARAGAQAGGASMAGGLQAAQIFSGRAKQLLRSTFRDKAREVLTSAVQDDELFRTLLTMPTSRPKVERIERNLNAWLGGAAVATQEE